MSTPNVNSQHPHTGRSVGGSFDEREHPRSQDGRFTDKPVDEADGGLDALGAATWDEAEIDAPVEDPGPADEFTWTRIESMMGRDFLLDPARTASIPKINADDNVAQMTRKLTRYIAKTQDFSDLTDEDVAALVGMHLPTDPVELAVRESNLEMIRKNFKVPDDERIVVAKGDFHGHGERTIYLSTRSSFNRTGFFSAGRGGQAFGAFNMADKMVSEKFRRGFVEANPELVDEFGEKAIDTMFRRLADKAYASKKNAGYWDESVFGDKVEIVVVYALVTQIAQGQRDGELNTEAIVDQIRNMTPDELREIVETLPVGETDSYSSVKGFHKIAAYVVPNLSNGVRVGQMYISVDEVHKEIAGLTPRSRKAALNRAYRAYLEEQLQLEYDFALNRKYVQGATSGHSATVFEQKKNVPATHLHAAEHGALAGTGDFRHIEIDADVDLERYAQIEREYVALRRHIPQTVPPALRFRKTGRHGAAGVYHPHADNVAVDPRHPRSMLHELAHHLDHTAGAQNISASQEFRPILRGAQRRIKEAAKAGVPMNQDYLSTPTEVHSRALELYFYWKKPGTSLNGDASKYDGQTGYETLVPMRDQIISFFDKKLAELGAEVPK